MFNEELIVKQIAKTGLVVDSDELRLSMVQGNDIHHPQIKQAFSDPNTKQFDKKM